METPEGTPRKSKIKINHPSQYFSVETARDTITRNELSSKVDIRLQSSGTNAIFDGVLSLPNPEDIFSFC